MSAPTESAEQVPGGNGFWHVGPTHVDFNVTNGCDLGCWHCHASSGSRLRGELTTDELLRAVDELYDLGVLSLAFAGGEPFLRRDMVEVLAHATTKPGWDVSVITNGTALGSSHLAEELARRCPTIGLNVSLDGSTAAGFSTLRRQRGHGTRGQQTLFDKVVTGISAAVAAELSVSVNFTVTAATIRDLQHTYGFVTEELGADSMVAIKFFPAGFGRDHLALLEIPYRRWSDEFSALTRLRIAGQLDRLQISLPAAWEFYLPLAEAGIDVQAAEQAWGYRSPGRDSHYHAARRLGDVTGVTELCLGADGSVYPGVLLSGVDQMRCGNIRERSLSDIWRNSDILRYLRNLSVDALDASCSRCPLQRECGGGSRARAWHDGGSLLAPDDLCPITRSMPHGGAAVPDSTPKAAPSIPMTRIGSGAHTGRVYRVGEADVQLRVAGRVVTIRGEDAAAFWRFATGSGDRTGVDRLLSGAGLSDVGSGWGHGS